MLYDMYNFKLLTLIGEHFLAQIALVSAFLMCLEMNLEELSLEGSIATHVTLPYRTPRYIDVVFAVHVILQLNLHANIIKVTVLKNLSGTRWVGWGADMWAAKWVNRSSWQEGPTGYHGKGTKMLSGQKGPTGHQSKRGQLDTRVKGANWPSVQKRPTGH